MRLLHTSDWHLGKQLNGRRRHEEHESFLAWLLDVVRNQHIDILLVSGDIYDTTTPSSSAQKLYFSFLHEVSKIGGVQVVVTSGNHDSPSLLAVTAPLLETMEIHVVAEADAEHECLVLSNADKTQEIGILAIPFLRERDVRISGGFETPTERSQAISEAIAEHIAQAALEMEKHHLPFVTMAHLFTAGATTSEDNQRMDLEVGTLSHVNPASLPNCCYVALGHIHVPQIVGGNPNIRYCGSPIPMSFSEAHQQKEACIIDITSAGDTNVTLLPIPKQRHIVRIAGDLPTIEAQLHAEATEEHIIEGRSIWAEISYTGDDFINDLRERVQEILQVLPVEVEVLSLRNERKTSEILRQQEASEDLRDMTPRQIFMRRLDEEQLSQQQQEQLLGAFDETMEQLSIQDVLEETP